MAASGRMAPAGLVREAEEQGGADFLRAGVRVLSPALRAVEASQPPGAERHARSGERAGERAG